MENTLLFLKENWVPISAILGALYYVAEKFILTSKLEINDITVDIIIKALLKMFGKKQT